MYIVTIYENGRRYFSSPSETLPSDESDTTIKGDGIRTDCKMYDDGSRHDAIFQKVTEQEFALYKADPSAFTAKQVF